MTACFARNWLYLKMRVMVFVREPYLNPGAVLPSVDDAVDTAALPIHHWRAPMKRIEAMEEGGTGGEVDLLLG